ncbi:hypothetical protein BC832DRAFT_127290 [Gaertneriomyces semiglobifer]|nr:hypothetical protein BC832DRAFT_127290 [Gaertneriomyces semiglobifer]
MNDHQCGLSLSRRPWVPSIFCVEAAKKFFAIFTSPFDALLCIRLLEAYHSFTKLEFCPMDEHSFVPSSAFIESTDPSSASAQVLTAINEDGTSLLPTENGSKIAGSRTVVVTITSLREIPVSTISTVTNSQQSKQRRQDQGQAGSTAVLIGSIGAGVVLLVTFLLLGGIWWRHRRKQKEKGRPTRRRGQIPSERERNVESNDEDASSAVPSDSGRGLCLDDLESDPTGTPDELRVSFLDDDTVGRPHSDAVVYPPQMPDPREHDRLARAVRYSAGSYAIGRRGNPLSPATPTSSTAIVEACESPCTDRSVLGVSWRSSYLVAGVEQQGNKEREDAMRRAVLRGLV